MNKHLSEDDRRRFNFFLGDDILQRLHDDPSLRGTLCILESLFDQDKINEQDITYLINAFDKIQCLDAVKLLREHMRQMQSNGLNESVQSLSILMPSLIDQISKDQEEDKLAIQMPLINRETFSNNNNIIINSNINSQIITDSNQTRISPSKTKKQLLNISFIKQKYLIVSSILSLLIEAGVVIGGCVWIMQLKMENNQLNNQIKNNNNLTKLYIKDFLLRDNDILYQLKNLLSIDDEQLKQINKQVMENNEAIERLIVTVNFLEDEKLFSEGKTCGCTQWCMEHGSPYGVCGNGPTCICSSKAITRASVGDKCRCDAWCERRNHTKDGICGDGYTCICSP